MAAVPVQTMAQLTRWLVHDAPSGVDRTTLREETVRLLLCYLRKESAGSLQSGIDTLV